MHVLARRSLIVMAAVAGVFLSVSPATATSARGSSNYFYNLACCGNRNASNLYVYQVWNMAEDTDSQVVCVQEHVYPNWPSTAGSFFDAYKCDPGATSHTLNGNDVDQAYCWVNGGTVTTDCFENYNYGPRSGPLISASRGRQQALPRDGSPIPATPEPAPQANTAAAPAAGDAAIVRDAIAPLGKIGKAYGADPSQARATTAGPGRTSIWLVPGTSGACLVNMEMRQAAGSTCNATAAVKAGDLWTLDTVPYGARGAAVQVLIGAAPDGDTSATVSWTGGGTTVVPVTGHIYSVPIGAHSGWASVTLTNRSGHAQTAAGMRHLPRDAPPA